MEEFVDKDGNKVVVVNDDCSESPREFSNVGKMVCWHKRYKLGDKHEYACPENFQEQMIVNDSDIIILPVYMLDHSRVQLSTGAFSCPWDSGQIGWIYCTKNTVIENWGTWDDSSKESARKCMINEVECYSDYMNGDVFGYEKYDKNNELIDSCYGFIGMDHKASGLLEAAGV